MAVKIIASRPGWIDNVVQVMYDYIGLSTDTKPTTGAYGSTFFCVNTGNSFVYTPGGWVPWFLSVKASTPQVHIHTITITVVNGSTIQTDTITIDGVVCSFTSDATPTTAEISTGLQAAIAASSIAGKFVVSGTTNVVLTPAGTVDPVVAVSANLTDVQTLGTPVLGSAVLGAGEAHIGETGRWSDLIVVTPAIAAAAFSANDIVGGKLTLAGAVRVALGKGVLDSLALVDASKQNVPLSIFIFGSDLAGTYADNAAEAVTAADWLKWLGTIDILAADYKSMANASQVSLGGVGMQVKAATGTTLYALIVTTGTPTYGANALQLTFGMREGN